MFTRLALENCIFIDIETVPEFEDFDSMPERFKGLWTEKWEKIKKFKGRPVEEIAATAANPDSDYLEAAEFYSNAALFAEFGKIVCISLGRFKKYNKAQGIREFHLTSFCSMNEEALMHEMDTAITALSKKVEGRDKFNRTETKFQYCLVGHNIKEFDIPYLCRRMMVQGICLPDLIDCAGLKPWETPHLVDTLELWKFGDNKNYTGLDLLAARFNIESPKATMDGSQVFDTFYKEKDLEKIGHYCAGDVLTCANLLLRWRQEDILAETEVVRNPTRVIMGD